MKFLGIIEQFVVTMELDISWYKRNLHAQVSYCKYPGMKLEN